MKKHVKVYFDYFNIGEQDFVKCEVCDRQAVDIHHIEGRGKGKDIIENLMSLCRECHIKAHKSILGKSFLKRIHEYYLRTSNR